MSKKAQVSLFILIGIVAVIIVGVFIYQRGVQQEVIAPAKIDEMDAVQNFVQLCLDQTAHDSISYVLEEGGYYDDFSKSIYEAPLRPMTPAYLAGSVKDVPDITTIQDSLAQYVNEAVPLCTSQFSQFRELEIQESSPNTKVTITGNNILFEMDYKLKIIKQGSTSVLEKFTAKDGAEIIEMLKFAEEFVDEQKENQPYFQISALADIANENNLTFEWDHLEEAEIIRLVKTDSVFGEPLKLEFAIDYNESETGEE